MITLRLGEPLHKKNFEQPHAEKGPLMFEVIVLVAYPSEIKWESKRRLTRFSLCDIQSLYVLVRLVQNV
jgi:hypothetical protein